MARIIPYNEPLILRLLSQGNEEAFTIFYDHYRSKIYGVALRMLKSNTLAEDVVQEVFLKIWLKRIELPQVDRIESYLFMIARNHILNMLKSIAKEAKTNSEFLLTPSFEDTADHPVREKQYQELLGEVIDRLPPQQKQVYKLSRHDGLSHDDIARQLQISPFTVKKHMSKALGFIREHIRYLQSVLI